MSAPKTFYRVSAVKDGEAKEKVDYNLFVATLINIFNRVINFWIGQ